MGGPGSGRKKGSKNKLSIIKKKEAHKEYMRLPIHVKQAMSAANQKRGKK